LYYSFVDYAEEMKFTTSISLFMSYNFKHPKFKLFWAAFFGEGYDIARGSNRGGGWALEKGVQRQLKARGPVWGPSGPSLCSQH